MIPNTLPYYVFIRLSIWALRAVTPASFGYCLARALGWTAVPRLPWPLAALAAVEVCFFLAVSLPRQWVLNRSRPTVVQRSRGAREALFARSWASIPDFDVFLGTWFPGAAPASVCREDFAQFLSWAFFYETRPSPAAADEIAVYIRRTEEALSRPLPPGHGPGRPMQVSTDPLHLQHKPFIFYVLAIGTDDFLAYLTARHIGLDHYRLPLRQFCTEFPLRLHTLCTPHVSPSAQLSYWHRPHTSRTRLPVLFLHGIGAGIRTYTGFLRDFVRADAGADGQVGILAVELMAISMRVARAMLPRQAMLTEILAILDHHGWDRFVVIGHSYGTILATHLLHHLAGTRRIGPVVLADPVTLSMHWGDIPYRFLYRPPRRASEWQLHYFASTDMGVAHSITRRFDWTENVLWREDMRGRAWTVALASDDIIVDTRALQQYLAADTALMPRVYRAPDSCPPASRADGLDVLWYDGLNHSGIFESAAAWQPLVRILHAYCTAAPDDAVSHRYEQ